MKENMGLFDRFFKKPEPPKVEEPTKPKKEKKLSPKEQATLDNEPYVQVLGMEVDPNDINSGAFELDWNDKFVLNLIKSGYKIRDDDTDDQIVDRWFQTVCRGIALELYEQQQADPDNRYRTEMRVVKSKDLGDGRSEVS
jgi:hypothetical protein